MGWYRTFGDLFSDACHILRDLAAVQDAPVAGPAQ